MSNEPLDMIDVQLADLSEQNTKLRQVLRSIIDSGCDTCGGGGPTTCKHPNCNIRKGYYLLNPKVKENAKL